MPTEQPSYIDENGTKTKEARYIPTKTNERNEKQVRCINKTMNKNGNKGHRTGNNDTMKNQLRVQLKLRHNVTDSHLNILIEQNR